MGNTCFGACCEGSRAGVVGAESFEMSATRLRFSDLAGVLFGFSLAGSGVGAGAASSRARARVDRRGSDMSTEGEGEHAAGAEGDGDRRDGVAGHGRRAQKKLCPTDVSRAGARVFGSR
jgi:hypothetical protein